MSDDSEVAQYLFDQMNFYLELDAIKFELFNRADFRLYDLFC